MDIIFNDMFFAKGERLRKMSTKGITKRLNAFEEHQFMSVLQTGKSVSGTIKRIGLNRNSDLSRIDLSRTGLSYLMIKRKVMKDGISTKPLDI